MFVGEVFKEAGAKKALKRVSWPPLVSSYRTLPKVSRSAVKPGDVALYRGDSGHINIFTGRGAVTIGGNESNAVRRQSGYINSASSIRRPAFALGGVVPKLLAQDLRENNRRTTPLPTQILRAIAGQPLLFDDGGWLPVGASLVYNKTGSPEPVLTDAQWARISESTSGGDGGVHYHGHFDGLTKAAYESQFRTAMQAEAVLAARRDRTGRRREPMPLVTRQAGASPAPPASTRTRHPLPVTYVDPDGVEWHWSDPKSRVRVLSVTGIGGPPAAYTDTALAGGGNLPREYQPAKRSIVIGLHVYDDESQAGLLELVDQLTFALWTERAGLPAPGRLVVGRPDGTSRQIEVLCTSGPEHTDTDSTRDAYQRDTDYALTFESALDPLFQDAAPTGPIVFGAPPEAGGVPPMPPVLLTPSSTLGETTVTNS